MARAAQPADAGQHATQVGICDEGSHPRKPYGPAIGPAWTVVTLAAMALTATVLDSLELCEPHLPAWDALAVAARRPYCAPAWMLAWWRHVPSPDALLRVVVVHDDSDLVAVAPFYAEPLRGSGARYQILGAGTAHRAEPLARPEVADEAAHAIAGALAGMSPAPAFIRLESVDVRSGWPERLVRSWPGRRRPWSVREWSGPAPTIALDGLTFEGWLKGKSRNFRSQWGRKKRRLGDLGASLHVAADPEELTWVLGELSRLHYARWRERGGSVALTETVERALREAGRELLESGRFRVVWIEVGGRAISAHLFVAAGGEVSYWNGGFDEEWAAEQPAMQALIAAIEDAFSRSEGRFDLGGGAEPYKYRLADREDTLETTVIAPRTRRYLLTRLERVPGRMRREISRRLPARTRVRLKSLRR